MQCSSAIILYGSRVPMVDACIHVRTLQFCNGWTILVSKPTYPKQKKENHISSPYAWSFFPLLISRSFTTWTHSLLTRLLTVFSCRKPKKKKKNMHTEACNERNSWMIQPLYPGAYPCTLHGWSSTVRSLVFCLIWSDPNIVLHFYHTMTEFLEVFGLIAPTLPNSNLAI